MRRRWPLSVLVFLAASLSLALLGRSAPADPIGVVVSRNDTGLVVTVNATAANIFFTYQASGCGGHEPCFVVNASQGPVGISASAPACAVQQGNASTPTGIECPATGVRGVQFKLVNGGTWSAYSGGGGQHAGTSCSPARVSVITGSGANSVESWDGCNEVIFCDSGSRGFAGVDADAFDSIRGRCSSVVRH